MSLTPDGLMTGAMQRLDREYGFAGGRRAAIAADKFIDFNRRAIAQGAREVGRASREALRLAGRGIDYSQNFGRSFREEFFGGGVSTGNTPIPGTKTTPAEGTTPLAARTR